jgi:hypothetical protein
MRMVLHMWYVVRNYAGKIMGVWSDEDTNIPWYSEEIEIEELEKEIKAHGKNDGDFRSD